MGYRKNKLEYEPILAPEEEAPIEYANLDNSLIADNETLYGKPLIILGFLLWSALTKLGTKMLGSLPIN